MFASASGWLHAARVAPSPSRLLYPAVVVPLNEGMPPTGHSSSESGVEMGAMSVAEERQMETVQPMVGFWSADQIRFGRTHARSDDPVADDNFVTCD